MSEVIEQTKRVGEKLISTETYKEYNHLKTLYENDEELKRMRKEIARLEAEGKKEEANNLRNLYNAHPLVNNYYAAKDEFEQLLKAITNLIQ